jgi:cyclase
MKRIRVIPVLQLKGEGLYKTVKFRSPRYIGDPINAVKIFNEKEVDELAFIDIEATITNKEPNYNKIEEIASECFMPLAYGGGIKNIEQAKKIFSIGIEKIIINTAAYTNTKLIEQIAKIYGNQSVVVAIDVKKDFFGKKRPFIKSASEKIKTEVHKWAKTLENAGSGEIILTSVDHDGTFKGYDIDLIKKVSETVSIPVVANGGASKIEDFKMAIIDGGASAVAAGSLFVYKSQNRGILINYPSQKELKEKIFEKLS